MFNILISSCFVKYKQKLPKHWFERSQNWVMKVLAVYRDDVFNDHAEILKIYVFCHSHDVDLFITRTFVKDNTCILKLMQLLDQIYDLTLDIFKSIFNLKMFHTSNLLQNLNKKHSFLFLNVLRFKTLY